MPNIDEISSTPAPRQRELSPGFMRQRRNLLVISLLLVLFYVGEMTVDTLNIFGSIIRVEKPHSVAVGVWLIFGYAFLRFVQYYIEEGPASETIPGMFEAAFQQELKIVYARAAQRAGMVSQGNIYLEQALSKPTHGGQNEYLHDRIERKKSALKREVKVGMVIGDAGYEKRFGDHKKNGTEPDEKEVKELLRYWDNEEFKGATDRRGASFTTWIEISLLERLFARIRGGSLFLLGRSFFTDYQLPFILSILAAVLAAYWAVS